MVAPRHPDVLHIAALGDLHCTRGSQGRLRGLFDDADARADVIALCGDLTDYGTIEEAEILLGEMQPVLHLPIVAVLGNHDFESDDVEGVRKTLQSGGVHVLDGGPLELHGISFVGTKGFSGGFAHGTLSPWGEPATKRFVQEAIDEALKLERALGRARSESRVVLLHYAPIHATLVGEHPEIIPFLGSGRLEEPLNRYQVSAVLHGHAHLGSPEGRTGTGIPVYNVALPLLRRLHPDRPPYRLIAVARDAAQPSSS